MERFHWFLLFVVIVLAFFTGDNVADDYMPSTNNPLDDGIQSSLPPCRKCVWELTEDEAEARFDALENVTEADLLRFQEETERCPCTGQPDISTETIKQMQQHYIEIKRQNPDLWPPNVTACCEPKDEGKKEPGDGCNKYKGHRRQKRFSCTRLRPILLCSSI